MSRAPAEEKQNIIKAVISSHESFLQIAAAAFFDDFLKVEGGPAVFHYLWVNLKSFENREEHNKRSGKPSIDVGWMWERLNIERE